MVGGVVLVGGRSTRMGTPKALLDWHGTPAVAHAVATVHAGLDGGPVCVVRAPGQELPPLDAVVVEDAVTGGGPLAALLAGLETLAGEAEIVFACGVDTPLLEPGFIRAVCGALREADDAVVPVLGGRRQPLLAAYRTAICPSLRALLDRGARSLGDISDAVAVRSPSEHELGVDAAVAANANTPEEWAALLALP